METAANEKITIEVDLHVREWAYSEFMSDHKGRPKGDAKNGFWWGIDVEIDKEMFELWKESNLSEEVLPFHFDMFQDKSAEQYGMFDIWFDDHSDESKGKDFDQVSFSQPYEHCVEDIKEYAVGFLENKLESYLEYYREQVECAEENDDIESEREILARLEAFFKKAA